MPHQNSTYTFLVLSKFHIYLFVQSKVLLGRMVQPCWIPWALFGWPAHPFDFRSLWNLGLQPHPWKNEIRNWFLSIWVTPLKKLRTKHWILTSSWLSGPKTWGSNFTQSNRSATCLVQWKLCGHVQGLRKAYWVWCVRTCVGVLRRFKSCNMYIADMVTSL